MSPGAFQPSQSLALGSWNLCSRFSSLLIPMLFPNSQRRSLAQDTLLGFPRTQDKGSPFTFLSIRRPLGLVPTFPKTPYSPNSGQGRDPAL